jgi:hypothetical protein
MIKQKKTKFWLFYLIDIDEAMYTEEYDLYAFTDNEELAKGFIDTRNMDKFFVKEVKMTLEERNSLLREYLNSELVELKGTTKGSHYKIHSFTIPVTSREKMYCMNDETIYIHEYLYQYVWGDPEVFKNKYQKALMTIGFVGLHELIIENGDDDVWSETAGKMLPDTFNMLMHHSKKLFIDLSIEGNEE